MVDDTKREFTKTFLLIDGHALAFRSYFALERTGMGQRSQSKVVSDEFSLALGG